MRLGKHFHFVNALLIIISIVICNKTYAIWPVVGEDSKVCGSYGTRENDLFHDGIDICGKQVQTVARVKVMPLLKEPIIDNENVTFAEVDEHDNYTGTLFRYNHLILDRTIVKDWAILKAGTVFATATNSIMMNN